MSFNLLRRAAIAPASAARAFSTSSPRSIARITIVGNLADSPEIHSTNSGREIVRYAIASNTGPASNRKTSWFRVTSFAEGPSRDFLLNLPKGYVISRSGRNRDGPVANLCSVLLSSLRVRPLKTLTKMQMARTRSHSTSFNVSFSHLQLPNTRLLAITRKR